MADILNITGLGKLEIVETYVYYDQPVLFSCILQKRSRSSLPCCGC